MNNDYNYRRQKEMKLKIRALKNEDLPMLRTLILEAENFGEPFLGTELRTLKWDSIPDLGKVFVATVKNQPVGYISLRKKVFALNIDSIIVGKTHQKQGIGRALIEKAKDYAKSHGFKLLRVDTGNFMDYAIKFYIACGFLPCGYVENDFGLGTKQLHFYMDLTQ
jgi:ribosomal protein S18 acetylase RimI-like enzyme